MAKVTLEEKDLDAQIEQRVKAGIEEELKKVNSKFIPGSDGVTKDAGDQPWGEEITLPNGKKKQMGMGAFLQAVKDEAVSHSRTVDPRLLRTKAATGAGESIPSDGGFMLTQEFIPTVKERLYTSGIVLGQCGDIIQIGPNSNGARIPAVDETSRANGSRWGGVLAYWENEGGSPTATKPAIRQISMELNKLFALCYVTDELLADSMQLEGYVNKWFGLEMAFKVDDALINGDGTGKPQGILNSKALVTITAETGQVTGTILAKNITKMWKAMWAPSRSNAVWFINQETEDQLMTLNIPIGTAGTLFPLYVAPGMPGNTSDPNAQARMMNRPVYVIEQAAALSTAGDVILADMSQYQLIEKGGLNGATSIHVAFLTDQTAFRFTWRLNGQSIWNSDLTPYKGSQHLSPFVVIASR